ncbi:MAG: 16S rRNA (cytosine(1402)-N(4))-methyltransferase RsmH [Acholeplasmataceae bacterium]|nr:16S rRNA (cytosine(1402)-N(4))-methyltransferase RsmH [Acholeplasmataceae bacterium]
MKHETVLLHEAIHALKIKQDGIYVDGTLGGAGHSKCMLNELKNGFLYAFDQDQYAIDYAKNVLRDFSNYKIIKSNFRYIKQELNHQNIFEVDGILLDLGLSSFQIDDELRGFTYLKETTLDMRMDQSQELTAEMIVNTYTLEELAKIFYLYGEEKNSFKIAREIILKRPLQTTMDLVKITDKINRLEKGHSAKRVFQALRIAVNDELGALEQVLKDGLLLLKPGGRMVVITFHSLEDRIVKHYFKEKSTVSIPKNLPIQHVPEADYELVTTKPIYPTDLECEQNSRSKSAKMRVIQRRII